MKERVCYGSEKMLCESENVGLSDMRAKEKREKREICVCMCVCVSGEMKYEREENGLCVNTFNNSGYLQTRCFISIPQ
jgi:hypothetical protein